MKTSYSKAFTLIELIVVIGIIALIATLGLSTYNNIQKSARDTKRKSDVKEFIRTIKTYQINEGKDSPGEVWCDSSIGSASSACPISSPQDNWNTSSDVWVDLVGGGYVEKLPVDPINDKMYYYYYEPYNSGGGGLMCARRLEKTGTRYCLEWESYP